ncbi:MAG: type III-B CRISPR module-associated protein Cmr3 [Candidatus Freyarchaeota archaeon]
MKRLFFEPLDVLMFRSERPFIARESHVAKIGVISPITFEGAIRTKIFLDFCKNGGYNPTVFQRKKNEDKEDFRMRVRNLAEEDDQLKECLQSIGHPCVSDSPGLIVRGAFLAKKREYSEYFPVPNDLVMEDKSNGRIIKLEPRKLAGLRYSLDESLMLGDYSQIKNAEGLISFEELKKYLEGNTSKAGDHNPLKKPYSLEVRPGIMLDKGSKTAEEGYLYSAEFLRLPDEWGFVVWYENIDSLQSGLVRLGGEGRGAYLRRIDERDMDFMHVLEEINEERRFKLYLATPSCFRGCKPPENLLKRELDVDSLKLISALPGKPVYIGGYDFAMNEEKPLKRWVNAGGVYYYEFEGKIGDVRIPIKIKNEEIDMRCAFLGRW